MDAPVSSMTAGAQESSEPSFSAQASSHTDEFSVSDVVGQAGQDIPLNIKPNPSAPPEDLFAITGLPPEVKLSNGSAYDDFWLARRKDLASLTIITPDAFSRKFEIAITQSPVREQSASYANGDDYGESKASLLGYSDCAAGHTWTHPLRAHAERYRPLREAREKFKKGDVAGARAIFEVLALKGDPDAAIAMGETYDPVVLAQLYVKGLQPDEKKAISWYKKAEEFGDQRARTRLNALNQN